MMGSDSKHTWVMNVRSKPCSFESCDLARFVLALLLDRHVGMTLRMTGHVDVLMPARCQLAGFEDADGGIEGAFRRRHVAGDQQHLGAPATW